MIPRSYGELVAAGRKAQVQILLDGSDSNTASIAKGYAETVLQNVDVSMKSQGLSAARTGCAVPGGCADARLVQQHTRIEELRGARADRGDPDDHLGAADVADDRARVGDRGRWSSCCRRRCGRRRW